MLRLSRLLIICMLAVVLVPRPSTAAPSQQGCFPDVPGAVDCIDSALLSYWRANGGLAVFGYPISPLLPEETADGLVMMQHFERNRLELHPTNPAPYNVLLGRLGADRLTQLGRAIEAPVPATTDSACQFFPQTGHNVCGAILNYWRSHGLDYGDAGVSERESLALHGLPLTEARLEINSSGDHVLTQWFERVRLEDHSQRVGQPLVLGGRLDAEIQAALIPAAPAAGPVNVAGSQLVQNGQVVKLKGMNYYPADHPWGLMWAEWDGPAIAADLARARRELGINVVRVLVPYEISGWSDSRGNVAPIMLDRLRELVQIAGDQQLKVIITLFDWHDGVAPPQSEVEGYELNYLRTIVGAFKDDDRVLAWDLHNEPDNYGPWKEKGQSAQVIDWLRRMANAVRAIDSLHPITVGMTQPENLWVRGLDGRTIADISDIISVHSYDAARLERIAAEVRAHTDKPILLEEFGWPTGPDCRAPHFEQNSQLFLFRQAANALQTSDLAGGLSWWFRDIPLTDEHSVDENAYFGLYDHTGQPKPAVGPFRSVRVPALPSRTSTASPLTRVELPDEPTILQPIIFDDGIVLRDEFKYFWMFFGGEAMFGRPLTLAYRDTNDQIVQYFERARLELQAGKPRVSPLHDYSADDYLRRMHLTPLGQQAAASHSFPPVADPQQPGVRYFTATGHTLRGDFLRFWDQWGEPFFGPPLSEEVTETIDGQLLTVQYFTYWRFERWADGSVHLSNLGSAALQNRQCPQP